MTRIRLQCQWGEQKKMKTKKTKTDRDTARILSNWTLYLTMAAVCLGPVRMHAWAPYSNQQLNCLPAVAAAVEGSCMLLLLLLLRSFLSGQGGPYIYPSLFPNQQRLPCLLQSVDRDPRASTLREILIHCMADKKYKIGGPPE